MTRFDSSSLRTTIDDSPPTPILRERTASISSLFEEERSFSPDVLASSFSAYHPPTASVFHGHAPQLSYHVQNSRTRPTAHEWFKPSSHQEVHPMPQYVGTDHHQQQQRGYELDHNRKSRAMDIALLEGRHGRDIEEPARFTRYHPYSAHPSSRESYRHSSDATPPSNYSQLGYLSPALQTTDHVYTRDTYTQSRYPDHHYHVPHYGNNQKIESSTVPQARVGTGLQSERTQPLAFGLEEARFATASLPLATVPPASSVSIPPSRSKKAALSKSCPTKQTARPRAKQASRAKGKREKEVFPCLCMKDAGGKPRHEGLRLPSEAKGLPGGKDAYGTLKKVKRSKVIGGDPRLLALVTAMDSVLEATVQATRAEMGKLTWECGWQESGAGGRCGEEVNIANLVDHLKKHVGVDVPEPAPKAGKKKDPEAKLDKVLCRWFCGIKNKPHQHSLVNLKQHVMTVHFQHNLPISGASSSDAIVEGKCLCQCKHRVKTKGGPLKVKVTEGKKEKTYIIQDVPEFWMLAEVRTDTMDRHAWPQVALWIQENRDKLIAQMS